MRSPSVPPFRICGPPMTERRQAFQAIPAVTPLKRLGLRAVPVRAAGRIVFLCRNRAAPRGSEPGPNISPLIPAPACAGAGSSGNPARQAPSCPHLLRASTPLPVQIEDVDGRHKAGHDEDR
jgi:hypothetical protein